MQQGVIRVSTRVFVVAVLSAAGFHYARIARKLEMLDALRTEEARLGAEAGAEPATGLDRLKTDVTERLQSIRVDPTGSELLASLGRLMERHGLKPPVIRSGQPRRAGDATRTPIDVEFKGSLAAADAVLRELSEGCTSWHLGSMKIEHGAARDPDNLSVRLQAVTFAPDEKEPPR